MEHSVKEHYDLLITEGNDPVFDPPLLQDYMNQWDGQPFMDALNLTGVENVLEIGIGTGRLAIKTAPLCKELMGIDLSPMTIEKAEFNLSEHKNVTLVCADFMRYEFDHTFDVIYSSLTFMHIKDKQSAISKIADLLSPKGKMVLSIDKNQSQSLDMGNRIIKVYPDTPESICECMRNTTLKMLKTVETEFAFILVAVNK